LLESLCHKSSFIVVNRPIYFSLDFVHPFAVNQILTGSRRNKVPGVVAHKSRILSLHGLFQCGSPKAEARLVSSVSELARRLYHTVPSVKSLGLQILAWNRVRGAKFRAIAELNGATAVVEGVSALKCTGTEASMASTCMAEREGTELVEVGSAPAGLVEAGGDAADTEWPGADDRGIAQIASEAGSASVPSLGGRIMVLPKED
jgi:hypothetical protein